jgi:adenylate kinase family enzyme
MIGTAVRSSLPSLRRISVVGSTGSGKTHLARRLSRRLGIPLIELDRLKQASQSAAEGQHQAFANAVMVAVSQDSWIIDGHYREIRQLVWQQADLVILLDYPLTAIIRQLIRRYLATRGQSRAAARQSSQAAAAQDRPASWRKRLRRLTKTLAERREYAQVLGQIDNSEVRLKRFTSAAATEEWLQSLPCSGRA